VANWYVNSSTGSNSYDGTSATFTSGTTGPWSTLAYALGKTFSPADNIYLAAIAGNAASNPTSGADYLLASYLTPTPGSNTAGYVSLIGTGGMPTVNLPGLGYYACSYFNIFNIYHYMSGAVAPTFGFLSGSECIVDSCVINLNGQSMAGVNPTGGCEIRNSTFRGSATFQPGSASGAHLISAGGSGNSFINNTLYNGRADGINEGTNGNSSRFNRIYGCAGNGFTTANVTAGMPTYLEYNTIDANLGDGVHITGTAGASVLIGRDNTITNNGGNGLYFANGTAAVNVARIRYWGYNNLDNNPINYSGFTAPASDVSINPNYVNPATSTYAPPANYLPVNPAIWAGKP
jgi:hypothetical protein